jgi:tRNA(His) 5'-end guanylyltransferase
MLLKKSMKNIKKGKNKMFDNLGTRMKENYEKRARTYLMRRCPVTIRIDGKAFHSFTRGFKKPFDPILTKAMQETMKYLCENIQGCVFGYTQSDEITLILVDYQKLNSDAWFDNEVQKICSVAASMTTMAFNKFFSNGVSKFAEELFEAWNHTEEAKKLFEAYNKALSTGAMFDARCFNIPKEEVTNLIYWRQQDATRNSIQMAARAYYSHKECDNKNQSQLQDMLMEKGINWNNYPTMFKRGSACKKIFDFKNTECIHSKWIIDYEMPILKDAKREYVEECIRVINDEYFIFKKLLEDNK